MPSLMKRTGRRWPSRIFGSGGLLLLALGPGCAHNPPGASFTTPANTITGTLGYRERIAMPPDAVIEVRLADVSRQDAPALYVAQTTILPAGRQVPIPFELQYDPALIDTQRTYAVRATVRTGSVLHFTTTQVYPVLTRGSGSHVDLLLERAQGPGTPETELPQNGLVNTRWRLTHFGMTPIDEGITPTLEFSDPAKIAGSGSCNKFFGTVDVEGERIRVHPLGTTRMACRDELMALEDRYVKSLQEAERYMINGPELTIYSRASTEPLRFLRLQ
jgi:putative lipoprotein